MLEILLWIFLISAGIQFLFFALVTLAIHHYKLPPDHLSEKPGVSVVVCAKNEYENLQKLIPALLSQKYPDFEIILVDDKSSDETYDYAIDLEQREKKFRLLRIDATPDHIHNKKYAITLGVKSAKNDIILLTDADCLPASESWIHEMSKGFSDEKKQFVLGYSQYRSEKSFLSTFINYETLLTGTHYIGIGLLGNPYMGVGRNLAYRKSVFLKNNGFGRLQGIVGGDDDLIINQHARKRNTSIVLSEQAMVYSMPKTSIKDFLLQKTRHLSVGRHYRKSDRLLLGLLITSKCTFWISFIAAIMAVNQTILIGGGFLLVMVSLLTSISALKKKTGDNTGIWMFPLLDILYLFYYITTGLKVLFTKKIKWK
jgi:poly-beta-1,6-N-acetyl-D-glucosamine synthase